MNAPKVVGLSCPNCGGALTVERGLRVLSCPYCSSQLLGLGEVGIRRFTVPVEVSSDQALARVSEWWRSGFRKHPGLKTEAKTAGTFLCFVPFFRAEADAVGYAFGVEERRRTVGSGKNRRTETYEVDVEKRVEQHYERNFPAVNTAELGIARIDLHGDTLAPFEPETLERQGMVFAPTTSEVEARQRALDEFRQEADPASRLKRVHFSYLALLAERFTVVYYPFWLVRYQFRGRSYQALIDAEDGQLAYGKAPGNDLFRALALTACQAAACFLGTTGLQWAGSSDDSAGLVIGSLVAAAGIFWWGWRQFRYGGVVEDGTSKASDSVGGTIAQLSKRLPLALGGRR